MSKITLTVDGKEIEVGLEPKIKKEKTPKIICNIDGELIEFKNEKALKKFMWSNRPETVQRYNLEGEVIVPFELQTI